MLYLRSWLEDYVNLVDFTNLQLQNLLTLKSGEVEEIITVKDYFGGKVVVGKITNVRKHSSADKLKIFDVVIGEGKTVQIVSAAPNVEENMFVPVALVGATLPMGAILERSLRGEKSFGMCCGKSELMLESGYSSGLWELVGVFPTSLEALSHKDEFPIVCGQDGLEKLEQDILGKSICEVLPEMFPAESVLDIKYLADKLGSCGNHLGLALDIAICAQNLDLLTPKAKQLLDGAYLAEQLLNKVSTKNLPVQLDFSDTTGYTNTFGFYNLKLEKEYSLPEVLQKRMFLTGRNMIGGLADLSNYLLADVGQPNHFFSSQKLYDLQQSGDFKWSIKKLDKKVDFAGLGQLKSAKIGDNVEVLVDVSGNVLTIPGISGGQSTKVDAEEIEVFIEVANFPTDKVAQSSFNLNYRSDGSKIWASGVRLELQFLMLVRMLEILDSQDLIYQLQTIEYWLTPELMKEFRLENTQNFLTTVSRILEVLGSKEIQVDFQYISDRLDSRGLQLWIPKIEEMLPLLGQYKLDCLRPHLFYGKILTQEDLVENLVRLIGFDTLRKDSLLIDTETQKSQNYAKLLDLKELIASFGFQEVITRPFIESDKVMHAGKHIDVLNPYDSTKSALRDSFFTGLLKTVNDNLLDGHKNPRIFELNNIYHQENRKLVELQYLQAVMVWGDPYPATSFLKRLEMQTKTKHVYYKELVTQWQEFGQGWSYHFENGLVAHIFELRNSLKKEYNLPLNKKIWLLSLELNEAVQSLVKYREFRNQSDYPVITRSYSFVLKKPIHWQEIIEMAKNNTIPETQIYMYPQERFYQNESEIINFEVEFVSYDRTLKGDEIESWENYLIKELDGIATKR